MTHKADDTFNLYGSSVYPLAPSDTCGYQESFALRRISHIHCREIRRPYCALRLRVASGRAAEKSVLNNLEYKEMKHEASACVPPCAPSECTD